jgi:hypothetical protein
MGNNPISGVDPDGGWLFTRLAAAASRFVSNLNSFFKEKYGIENGFSVEKVEVEHKSYASLWDWIKGKETVTVETYYQIQANEWSADGLSEENKLITNSFRDMLNAPTAIEGMFVSDNFDKGKVFKGSGKTYNSGQFAIPVSLPDFNQGLSKKNVASQVLHEMLWHISPLGANYMKRGETAGTLYNRLGVSGITDWGNGFHPGSNYLNKKIPIR